MRASLGTGSPYGSAATSVQSVQSTRSRERFLDPLPRQFDMGKEKSRTDDQGRRDSNPEAGRVDGWSRQRLAYQASNVQAPDERG